MPRRLETPVELSLDRRDVDDVLVALRTATMTATVVLALGGNMAIAAAQAGLVLYHWRKPADAVTTANGLGTLVGLLGPVAIGAGVAAGFGWRPVVLVTVPMSVVMAVVWLRMPASRAMTPRGQSGPTRADPPRGAERTGVLRRSLDQLPAAGWWFLLAMLMGVAIENATTFWALPLMTERTGAGTAVAAAAVAAFIGGMATSRLISWWFTARYPPSLLVIVAFGVTAVGWLALWLATVPPVAILGLAVSGMGWEECTSPAPEAPRAQLSRPNARLSGQDLPNTGACSRIRGK